jgi:phosphoglycerol transferase MdoB-like AlkP superfamily enzyme
VRLLLIAWLITIVGGLHFDDHVERGNIVVALSLEPTWNHSGWPFLPAVTPFTFSLFGVALLLGGGLIGTTYGRLWAGYGLTVSIVLFALVVFVHFFGAEPEFPSVIYATYAAADRMGIGVLALVDLFALFGLLIAAAINALSVARESGRW